MLKVTLENKVLVVENPPHGKISLSKDYLIGLKKDNFKESHKHLVDTEAVWKAAKPFTVEKKWKE